ncbi:hypothetical protein GCM10009799_07180 [Nocardiopsis rhodophaea]|uniref:PDZ domain-containing protein n=1 Tax=Nocardiopsis rhodophaea TaxID=280238 RepID=A0ABN2SCX6_9ACTN
MSANDPHGGVPTGEGHDDRDQRDVRDEGGDGTETPPAPNAGGDPNAHDAPRADDATGTAGAGEAAAAGDPRGADTTDTSAPAAGSTPPDGAWRSAVANHPPRAQGMPGEGYATGTGTFWHFSQHPPQQPPESAPGADAPAGQQAQQTPPSAPWTPGASTTQTFGAVPGGPTGPGGHGVPGGQGGPDGPSGPQPAPGGYGGGAGHGAPPEGVFGMPPAEPGPQQQGRPWGRRKLLGAVAATAVVTSLIVGPAAAVATTYFLDRSDGPSTSSLTNGQASSVSTGSVSKVAEKVLPSVVSIQAGRYGGSGVIISSDGEILTNNHVVSEARGDTVLVQFNDGSEAEAKILGTDPVSDLAVVKAKGKSGLTPATLGDSSKIQVGADVVAIGSPLGLSGTVTSGVVSALDRPVNTGRVAPNQPEPEDPLSPFGFGEPNPGGAQPQTSTVINAIQTDAPINPGNSGGPLMNMNGEVIGINTAIASLGQSGDSGSVGLGFAIPINQAKPIAEQLIKQGSASYAAIDATITRTRDGNGVAIVDTAKNGAAAEAGLKRGDIITSVNDKQVDSPDALIAEIRSQQPGDKVKIGYERDGKDAEVELTLSAQSANGTGS